MAPKTIIVTGSSRGLGLAIAQYLLENSHNVIIQARTEEPLEGLRNRYPKQVRTLVGDLSDFSLSEQLVKKAVKEFGQLDSVIINHGTFEPVARIADSEAESWRTAFDVNFFSAVALARVSIPALRETKGSILLTSSGLSISAISGVGAYGASKAAINHLALTLSAEEKDITTIAIAPGMVDTEMQREIRENHISVMSQKEASKFVDAHSKGALLKPEQPGNVMARLVLRPPKQLSGRYIRWNDKDLVAFQDA